MPTKPGRQATNDDNNWFGKAVTRKAGTFCVSRRTIAGLQVSSHGATCNTATGGKDREETGNIVGLQVGG